MKQADNIGDEMSDEDFEKLLAQIAEYSDELINGVLEQWRMSDVDAMVAVQALLSAAVFVAVCAKDKLHSVESRECLRIGLNLGCNLEEYVEEFMLENDPERN